MVGFLREPKSRLVRWRLIFEEFESEFEYKTAKIIRTPMHSHGQKLIQKYKQGSIEEIEIRQELQKTTLITHL